MKKLIFPIITILLFLSCGPMFFYNVQLAPLQQESVKSDPIMLNGMYRQDLFFRALIAKTDKADNTAAQYRIIVLNDFGIELFQMETRGIGVSKTSITKSILPKKVLNDFASFFLYYLYDAQQNKVEEINGKIHYKMNNKSILWAQKENEESK